MTDAQKALAAKALQHAREVDQQMSLPRWLLGWLREKGLPAAKLIEDWRRERDRVLVEDAWRRRFKSLAD